MYVELPTLNGGHSHVANHAFKKVIWLDCEDFSPKLNCEVLQFLGATRRISTMAVLPSSSEVLSVLSNIFPY